ncbi:MAG: bacteriohemerythrin [Pseudomonadota bacterium]
MENNSRWHSQLKVGSDVIDNQHKVLFDLIKDLSNSIRVGASIRGLDVLLGVLRDYAFKHFQTEEDYFENHSGYTKHCLEHYTLLKRLNDFIIDFRNNRVSGNKTPSAFLEDWLLEHIENYDKPYFSQEKANGWIIDEPLEIDDFEPGEIGELQQDVESRRRYKRLSPDQVVDGDLHINFYNASQLISGKAKIVDMSPGGLKLSSTKGHEIDDLLIISCSIGRTFKMQEKAVVKSVNNKMISVKFLVPSEETTDFFTKLYGSVYLNRAKLD